MNPSDPTPATPSPEQKMNSADARKMTLAFLNMPLHLKIEVARLVGVFREGDTNNTDVEMCKEYYRRAVAEGKLRLLRNAILGLPEDTPMPDAAPPTSHQPAPSDELPRDDFRELVATHKITTLRQAANAAWNKLNMLHVIKDDAEHLSTTLEIRSLLELICWSESSVAPFVQPAPSDKWSVVRAEHEALKAQVEHERNPVDRPMRDDEALANPPTPISSAPDGAGTPTPETDAEQFSELGGDKIVMADFARKLEQQRDALKRERTDALESFDEHGFVLSRSHNPKYLCNWVIDAMHRIERLSASLAQAQREKESAIHRETIANGNAHHADHKRELAESALTAASQEVEGLKADRDLLDWTETEEADEFRKEVCGVGYTFRGRIGSERARLAARSATPEELTK